VGFLNKLFGYRWSLQIVKNQNVLIYAMHENSVIRIIGYCMQFFENQRNPVSPWSIHLKCNKNNQSFRLDSSYFTDDGKNMASSLLEKIGEIDPGYMVKGSRPIFIHVPTKQKLELSANVDLSNLQEMADKISSPKEKTFYSVMNVVFGRD
jgi:hypothetical protein